jgi:septal ring factor EnvC (AmiA/AmiB activator)
MSCADTFLKSKLRKTSRRPQAPLRRRKLGLQSCARSSLNWLRSFQQARHVICDLDMTFCSPRLLQASHAKAEKKLQEERATLTRFDNELKELERVIKTKKQAVSDAELQLKKFEHDMQTLAKEKTAATNFVANLEKQFDWIQDESECVVFLLSFWFDGC